MNRGRGEKRSKKKKQTTRVYTPDRIDVYKKQYGTAIGELLGSDHIYVYNFYECM